MYEPAQIYRHAHEVFYCYYFDALYTIYLILKKKMTHEIQRF